MKMGEIVSQIRLVGVQIIHLAVCRVGKVCFPYLRLPSASRLSGGAHKFPRVDAEADQRPQQ